MFAKRLFKKMYFFFHLVVFEINPESKKLSGPEFAKFTDDVIENFTNRKA